MDVETYVLLNRKIKGLSSGIKSASVQGTSIEFTMNDNTVQKITFPTPSDGISIKNVSIDTSNHLLCVLTDDTIVDAGEIPSVSDNITSENGVAGLRVWNGKLQYKNSSGKWVALLDVPDTDDTIADKEDIDSLF